MMRVKLIIYGIMTVQILRGYKFGFYHTTTHKFYIKISIDKSVVYKTKDIDNLATKARPKTLNAYK